MAAEDTVECKVCKLKIEKNNGMNIEGMCLLQLHHAHLTN